MSGTFCPVACMAARERNVSNMVSRLGVRLAFGHGNGVWALWLGIAFAFGKSHAYRVGWLDFHTLPAFFQVRFFRHAVLRGCIGRIAGLIV